MILLAYSVSGGLTFNRRVNWTADTEEGIYDFTQNVSPQFGSTGSGLVIPASAIAAFGAQAGDVIGYASGAFNCVTPVAPPAPSYWQGAIIATA